MIEPPNKKEIAEFLEVGLRLGAFDYSAAIQWADSVLLMEDRPDIQIVEVSLSGRRGTRYDYQLPGRYQGSSEARRGG